VFRWIPYYVHSASTDEFVESRAPRLVFVGHDYVIQKCTSEATYLHTISWPRRIVGVVELGAIDAYDATSTNDGSAACGPVNPKCHFEIGKRHPTPVSVVA